MCSGGRCCWDHFWPDCFRARPKQNPPSGILHTRLCAHVDEPGRLHLEESVWSCPHAWVWPETRWMANEVGIHLASRWIFIFTLLILRYAGNGNAQMGMRLEGISGHDSGNWSLVVQPPNWEMIRTTFEIIVKPYLTTERDLPIRVQVNLISFAPSLMSWPTQGERKHWHCVRPSQLRAGLEPRLPVRLLHPGHGALLCHPQRHWVEERDRPDLVNDLQAQTCQLES